MGVTRKPWLPADRRRFAKLDAKKQKEEQMNKIIKKAEEKNKK